MASRLLCWRCGAALRDDLPRIFPRLEKCKACNSDLHVCVMCRHYAPQYIRKCAHDQAEPAREVDLANFCPHFRPRPGAYRGDPRADAARSALDGLFGPAAAADPPGDGAAGAPADDPLDALKQLFGDDGKPPGS